MAIDRQRLLDRVTRELMDRGLIIEAGWIGLRSAAIPPDAPDHQLEEMRNAFFAGAQHLYACLMSGGGRDPDSEPTEDDMRRLELIAKELDNFMQMYELKHFPPQGRA